MKFTLFCIFILFYFLVFFLFISFSLCNENNFKNNKNLRNLASGGYYSYMVESDPFKFITSPDKIVFLKGNYEISSFVDVVFNSVSIKSEAAHFECLLSTMKCSIDSNSDFTIKESNELEFESNFDKFIDIIRDWSNSINPISTLQLNQIKKSNNNDNNRNIRKMFDGVINFTGYYEGIENNIYTGYFLTTSSLYHIVITKEVDVGYKMNKTNYSIHKEEDGSYSFHVMQKIIVVNGQLNHYLL